MNTEATLKQIISVWTGLGARKRAVVGIAGLTMFLGVLLLARMAATPSMGLLYSGLEPGAAGEIVRILEQRKIPYEVQGDSIFVPSNQRDELRLTLAGEGLPTAGSQGYELLDNLSGFGTTSQMFDAAYWRAKEGELARTIVAAPSVSAARVHIANSGTNPFRRDLAPTASVSVTPVSGSISGAQANAIRHLVASAVSGLSVDDVSVVDINGTLVGSDDKVAKAAQTVDRAQVMREQVLRLVEARVGRGNAVVEVSLDTVTETEQIRERRFDPQSRVAISTEVEESADTNSRPAGDVTVASNIPDGDAAEAGNANSQTSRTRERINYEVSETEREIVRGPGAIKRLSVAVLVNSAQTVDENGETVRDARSEEELLALKELVESAVGFDAERGDTITIKSMDLPAFEPLGTAAGAAFKGNQPLDLMSLLQLATLGLVTIVLGIFVVKPILTSRTDLTEFDVATLPAPGPVLTGEVQDANATPATAIVAQDASQGAVPAVSREDTVQRLKDIVGEKQDETIEILRSWLEESKERA